MDKLAHTEPISLKEIPVETVMSRWSCAPSVQKQMAFDLLTAKSAMVMFTTDADEKKLFFSCTPTTSEDALDYVLTEMMALQGEFGKGFLIAVRNTLSLLIE